MNNMSSNKVPHVCVIGAGVCGIVATKICLENGLRVTCYDKSSKYGGLWCYREEEPDYKGPFEPSVMRTTILNTSKELSSFSDFPPPAHLPNFMRHSQYMNYIKSYVDNFELLPHIRLEHEILSCQVEWKGDTNQITWLVSVKNLKTGQVLEQEFDRLMIAVGHHNIPFTPKYTNQDLFKGEILHSARLKDILANDKFRDKNILVVGFGNSACDAANDLSILANKCYVSCHRGQWFISRFLENGPHDMYVKTRLHYLANKYLPTNVMDKLTINRLERRVNHKLLGLKPKHKPSELGPAINDLFPYRVYTGGIVLKSSIKTFTEHGVVFDGEDDEEYLIDIVVLATGYEAKIPFLDERNLGLRCNQTDEYELFLNIFAPHLKIPRPIQLQSATMMKDGKTLVMGDGELEDEQAREEAIKSIAFIGLVQPYGSITVISELQARYAALVFKGSKDLPQMSQMLKHIEQMRRMRSKAIRSHSRDQMVGDYVGYMSTVSKLIGSKPNLMTLFFKDHQLWKKLMFGPCVPYQFRLSGPGYWREARQTIMTTSERVNCGINEGKNIVLYKSRRKCLLEKSNQ